MGKYVISKLTQGLLLLFVVSILVFSMLYIMPGDPVEYIVGPNVPQEKMTELRKELGLDRPMIEQYLDWAGKAVHMNFGNSIITKMPVAASLRNRIPVTLRISLSALILQLVVSVPLGLLAAYRKDSLVDRTLMITSSFLQAVPNFWFSMMLILLFGVHLRWLPINGYKTWRHLILPVISVSIGGIAGTLRMTKTNVLDVFRERYVQTAYAKGLSKRKVIIRHVLRNSMILVAVMVFMALPWMISGSVIMENIFTIPGVGIYLTDAIRKQDFVVVQACIMIIAALTVICNVLSDIVMAILDPRIRQEFGGSGK